MEGGSASASGDELSRIAVRVSVGRIANPSYVVLASDVEADLHDVPVFHDIIAAFQAQQAMLPGFGQ